MYTDLLVKIKNAQQAGKEKIKVPFTKMDLAVLEILAKHNFIEAVAKKGRLPKRAIEIKLKYDGQRKVIDDVRFVSKPSRRMYMGYRRLRPVRQGYGLGVISTPQGIMSTREAKKAKLGGELLFEIW